VGFGKKVWHYENIIKSIVSLDVQFKGSKGSAYQPKKLEIKKIIDVEG
jgi:hypothetical protein